MTSEPRSASILIVDDAPKNIQVVASILKGEGHRMSFALNGANALARAEREDYDLILLDIMMPEMDGYAVCRRLKANPRTRDVPVIYLTARSDAESVVKGFETGAADYVTKPFNASELKARVRTHLELRRSLREIAEKNATLREQNVQLVEAARLREDVDSMIRHDLKTPLNAMIGFSQLLLMEESLTDKQREFASLIESSGYQLIDMLNRSFDLLKMEQGRYEAQPVPVDLLRVIRKVIADTENLAAAKALRVRADVREAAPGREAGFWVKGEELLCYSMLANLIKNALESSPEGEDIRVTLEAAASAQVHIHNKGAVPAEIRDRFFEKYATFGKKRGAGLGTYSAKLIAETLGGGIRLDASAPGETTVSVSLPLP